MTVKTRIREVGWVSGDARVRACAPRVGASRASKPRRDDREVSRARVSSRRRSRRASIAYHGVSLRRGEAARARASPRATARASARPNPRMYGMSGSIHCVIFTLQQSIQLSLVPTYIGSIGLPVRILLNVNR